MHSKPLSKVEFSKFLHNASIHIFTMKGKYSLNFSRWNGFKDSIKSLTSLPLLVHYLNSQLVQILDSILFRALQFIDQTSTFSIINSLQHEHSFTFGIFLRVLAFYLNFLFFSFVARTL